MGDVTSIVLIISTHERGWDDEEGSHKGRENLDTFLRFFREAGLQRPTFINEMVETFQPLSMTVYSGAWKRFPTEDFLAMIRSMQWSECSVLYIDSTNDETECFVLNRMSAETPTPGGT